MVVGWLRSFFYNWDFLGIEPRFGVTVAVVSYLLMGIGIGEVLGVLYFLFKLKSTKKDKRRKRIQQTEIWKDIIVTEYEFPIDSIFGLGLKVENKSRVDLEVVSAELIYGINSKTKMPLEVFSGEGFLPWAVNNKTHEYEAQTIEAKEQKTLIVLSWNKKDRKVWFPTNPLEKSKRGRSIVVRRGSQKTTYVIRDNRTFLSGSMFHFEIQFKAKNKKPYIYRGSITKDKKANIVYS